MRKHKKIIAMLLSLVLVFSNTSLTMADESLTQDAIEQIKTETEESTDNSLDYQILSQDELNAYLNDVGTSTD